MIESIIALIPVVVQVSGGIEALTKLVATLHANGTLTDAQTAQYREAGEVSDAAYDLELAKARG